MSIIPNQATKNMRNEWRAENRITLTNGMLLSIVTSKRFGGKLETYATASRKDLTADPNISFMVHRAFYDFSECMATSEVRVTVKAVNSQHASVCARSDEIVAMAEAHYMKKATEEAAALAKV
jgi:hypothetical protein